MTYSTYMTYMTHTTYTTSETNLIPSHGGYRKLLSYQTATLVYDLTVEFCNKFVTAMRMRDQMVQAARSGRQNIAEGCQASGTSKKTRQLKALERQFLAQGGFTERLYNFRKKQRGY